MAQSIEINGTTIAVEAQTIDPNAPWILFSNSLATNMDIFESQAKALGGCYNILRYDQRGHGGSSVTAQVDFDLLGADVLGLLDWFQIPSCVFVGLSMGVPTGLSAYRQAPSKFSGLVFIDGQSHSAPGASDQWQARIDAVLNKGILSFSEATSHRWIPSDNELLRARLVEMMAKTDVAGFVAAANALRSYDYSHVLAEIKVPVLTMAGGLDGATDELAHGQRQVAHNQPKEQE